MTLQLSIFFCFFFFFQAEDGIRDLTVTGVQTCALPISLALETLYRGALVVQLYQGDGRSHTRGSCGEPSRRSHVDQGGAARSTELGPTRHGRRTLGTDGP